MPADLPQSEFGGKVQKNRTHPKPPELRSAAEKLMLVYTTGDESGQAPPDDGASFRGEEPA